MCVCACMCVCVCVWQWVDESGLELRDTESLPVQAHKQLDKNRKSRQMKTEDRQQDEERQLDRQRGGQAQLTGETDRLAENQSTKTEGAI